MCMIRELNEKNFKDGVAVNSKVEREASLKSQETKKNPNMSSDYSAVSKHGDTLEISEISNKGSKNSETVNKIQPKMSEVVLKNCSKEKLKQLLKDGKISRQQYNKLMDKFKS